MKHGSLFSGIGGFELASEWMGWENVFHCEINEFGRKILNHYWPNSISYGDITKTDFTIHRGGIDILTGGFPCQPFSLAGKRKGTEDSRHLWPEMLRCIREVAPTYIVGENVGGIINWDGGLVFHQVQIDLEAEGYEIQPFVLPACAVNAPHRRDRVWFVAHSKNNGYRGINKFRETDGIKEWGVYECKGEGRDEIWPIIKRSCKESITANPSITRCLQREQEDYRPRENGQTDRFIQVYSDVANARNKGLQRESNKGENRREKVDGINDRRVNTPSFLRSDWSEFPTQPPVRSRNDGVSGGLVGITISKHRNESIKAYGNAIVPPLVYQIFKSIQKHEHYQTNPL